jgi:hypothetical protein
LIVTGLFVIRNDADVVARLASRNLILFEGVGRSGLESGSQGCLVCIRVVRMVANGLDWERDREEAFGGLSGCRT